MPCPYCASLCILYGKSKTGNQRYRCKSCFKTHSKAYVYAACKQGTGKWISRLVKESVGVRGIARLLNIAVTTVIRRIMSIAKTIVRPFRIMGKDYELDEVCTYVKKKTNLVWIAYAIRKDNKEVIDFSVGRRTNKTLKQVTDTLILSNARKVFTDKLHLYKLLLPRKIHCNRQYNTNHIERMNLTLRTHLKRLNRRTICYSKSIAMLSACVKIYFWG